MEGYTRECCYVVCFFVWQSWLARSVECSGIRFRRVLFGTYGFKSTKNPPPIDELKEFEDDMLKMVQSTKFKQVDDPFLSKLNNDTNRIKKEPKLLIAADIGGGVTLILSQQSTSAIRNYVVTRLSVLV